MRIRIKLRQFSYNNSQVKSFLGYTHLGFAKPKEKKANYGFVEVGSNWCAYIIVDRKQLFLRFYKYYQLGIEPLLSNSFETPTKWRLYWGVAQLIREKLCKKYLVMLCM